MVEQLFKSIDKAQLWEKKLIVPRGQLVKMAHTIDTNIYYIQEGSLRLYINSCQEEQTIRFGYTQNFITALDSFIHEQRSPIIIQALKKTRLLTCSKKTFLKHLYATKEGVSMWEQMLQSLILQQMEREVDLLTNTPDERYERVLKRSPKLFQEIPKKYIAGYLRMTPETLSRLKKR